MGGSLEGMALVGGSLEGGALVGGSLEGMALVGGSLEGGALVGGSLVGGVLVGGSLVGGTCWLLVVTVVVAAVLGMTGTAFIIVLTTTDGVALRRTGFASERDTTLDTMREVSTEPPPAFLPSLSSVACAAALMFCFNCSMT